MPRWKFLTSHDARVVFLRQWPGVRREVDTLLSVIDRWCAAVSNGDRLKDVEFRCEAKIAVEQYNLKCCELAAAVIAERQLGFCWAHNRLEPLSGLAYGLDEYSKHGDNVGSDSTELRLTCQPIARRGMGHNTSLVVQSGGSLLVQREESLEPLPAKLRRVPWRLPHRPAEFGLPWHIQWCNQYRGQWPKVLCLVDNGLVFIDFKPGHGGFSS